MPGRVTNHVSAYAGYFPTLLQHPRGGGSYTCISFGAPQKPIFSYHTVQGEDGFFFGTGSGFPEQVKQQSTNRNVNCVIWSADPERARHLPAAAEGPAEAGAAGADQAQEGEEFREEEKDGGEILEQRSSSHHSLSRQQQQSVMDRSQSFQWFPTSKTGRIWR